MADDFIDNMEDKGEELKDKATGMFKRRGDRENDTERQDSDDIRGDEPMPE